MHVRAIRLQTRERVCGKRAPDSAAAAVSMRTQRCLRRSVLWRKISCNVRGSGGGTRTPDTRIMIPLL